MKHTGYFLVLILLISSVCAVLDNPDKIKWDWVTISPNHLEYTEPGCKSISIQPTFRVENYTEINLEIFSKEYPNGVSTGQIFVVYADHIQIRKEEIREVIVCVDYKSSDVPTGVYEAILYVESEDRVYQIPLTLTVKFFDRFWQRTKYEVKRMWLQQLFVIPTPDGSYLSFNGYHFVIVIGFVIILIWALYIFTLRRV